MQNIIHTLVYADKRYRDTLIIGYVGLKKRRGGVKKIFLNVLRKFRHMGFMLSKLYADSHTEEF